MDPVYSCENLHEVVFLGTSAENLAPEPATASLCSYCKSTIANMHDESLFTSYPELSHLFTPENTDQFDELTPIITPYLTSPTTTAEVINQTTFITDSTTTAINRCSGTEAMVLTEFVTVNTSGFSYAEATNANIYFSYRRATMKERLLHHKLKNRKNYQEITRQYEVGADKTFTDVWGWRKYGQKIIKGAVYPRNYYRCTSSLCFAKKQVEQTTEKPGIFAITYTGEHNHPPPEIKNPQTGSTRALKRAQKIISQAADHTVMVEVAPTPPSNEFSSNATLVMSLSGGDEVNMLEGPLPEEVLHIGHDANVDYDMLEIEELLMGMEELKEDFWMAEDAASLEY